MSYPLEMDPRYGLKIGDVLAEGRPSDESMGSRIRHATGQHLLNLVMSSAVMGAGYEGLVKRFNREANAYEIYAKPPVKSVQGARQIGRAISVQYELAAERILFPEQDDYGLLESSELDTFVPATTNESPPPKNT